METFSCTYCDAAFGIAGEWTGSDDDWAAQEHFDSQVAHHEAGECVGLKPYPATGSRDDVERWWLDSAGRWLAEGCIEAAVVALSSAALDLSVIDAATGDDCDCGTCLAIRSDPTASAERLMRRALVVTR